MKSTFLASLSGALQVPDWGMNRMLVRVGAVRHKTFIRLFSGIAPYYLVNEYPKSGGMQQVD